MELCNNEIVVDVEFEGVRLDAFLGKQGLYKSRSLASKFCDLGKILVNDKVASKKLKLCTGDKISYEPAVEDTEILGEDIPLDIRFEDDDIIVLSKQAGLVCHPANGHSTGTLVNALINHCGKEHLFNSDDDPIRMGIVHRLDADTSGLMIVAKSNDAGINLQKAMMEHSTQRRYKTLVYGNIGSDTGKIDVPLIRTLNKRPKIIASNDSKAKLAVTSFNVVERIKSEFGDFTLLDCKIHTGRTHQIRAHMEYINHCVVGDPLYNKSQPKNFEPELILKLNRQFLHSWKISFNHPVNGKHLEFEDDLPKDLSIVLSLLTKY